ncbi:hypothetical protein [Lentzea californiensis]|uniref:hypothetical protein n=1 Tax=Lentzea californiensis TaxID=438851 RepID=UPI002165F432|nr:hypothetical protein [Lentzea californiensis]
MGVRHRERPCLQVVDALEDVGGVQSWDHVTDCAAFLYAQALAGIVARDGRAQLLDIMSESVFGLAVNGENTPVVVTSPDDVPCVIGATAPAHGARARPDASPSSRVCRTSRAWAEVNLTQLVGVLPEEGVDLLLNPGATSFIRLIASVLRKAAAEPGLTADGRTWCGRRCRRTWSSGPGRRRS